jgi:N-hydroxyarylamine O-acetyltransferase
VFDAAAYLDRIGYTGRTEPTAETLAALHRAHMLAVPFENLDLHLGRRNVLDPDHVFDKVVRRRRGGWCFELNGLFALLLEHLGYRVTRCAAAVVLSEPGTPDFAHLTLRVDLDEPWIADVGFGDSFTAPLRLDDPGDQLREGRLYRLEPADGRVTLVQEGRRQYVFTLAPRRMPEFQEMCDALQTPPGHFTDAPICSLLTEDGRVSLAGMRLITTTPAGRVERELADEAERAAVLRETFGVDLVGAPLTGSGSAPTASPGSTSR